jgi:hypothetical protein
MKYVVESSNGDVDYNHKAKCFSGWRKWMGQIAAALLTTIDDKDKW